MLLGTFPCCEPPSSTTCWMPGWTCPFPCRPRAGGGAPMEWMASITCSSRRTSSRQRIGRATSWNGRCIRGSTMVRCAAGGTSGPPGTTRSSMWMVGGLRLKQEFGDRAWPFSYATRYAHARNAVEGAEHGDQESLQRRLDKAAREMRFAPASMWRWSTTTWTWPVMMAVRLVTRFPSGMSRLPLRYVRPAPLRAHGGNRAHARPCRIGRGLAGRKPQNPFKRGRHLTPVPSG